MPSKKPTKKLSKSQKRTKKNATKELLFCHEYIAGRFNGTEAYLRVYKIRSKKAAGSEASKLLKKSRIKKKVKELLGKHLKKVEVTAENVVDELRKLAFQQMDDFVDFDGGDVTFKTFKEMGEKTACIKEIKTTTTEILKGLGTEQKIEMKMHDKKGSLELLGKHLQLFNDKDPQLPNLNINIDAKDIQSKSAAEIARYYSDLLKSSDKGK